MVASSSYEGLAVTSQDLRAVQDRTCAPCVEGKGTKTTRPSVDKAAVQPLEVVHIDTATFSWEGINGMNHFIVIKDEATGYINATPVRKKSSIPETLIDKLVTLQRQSGRTIKQIRTDNGGEFTAASFVGWCNNQGIRHGLSPPYAPESNGTAERAVRTIKEMVRTMRLANPETLPHKLWPVLIQTAAYLYNRWPTKDGTIPQQALLPAINRDGVPMPIKVDHLRIIGSQAFMLNRRPTPGRALDSKTTTCTLVGYDSDHRVYKLWHPEQPDKILRSADVRIVEKTAFADADAFDGGPQGPLQVPDQDRQQGPEQGPQQGPNHQATGPSTPAPTKRNIPVEGELSFSDYMIYDCDTPSERAAKQAVIDERLASTADQVVQDAPEETEQTPSQTTSTTTTTGSDTTTGNSQGEAITSSQRYPQRTRTQPGEWWKAPGASALVAAVDLSVAPATFQEAISRPDAPFWWDAMCSEMASQSKFATFDIVPLPEGFKALNGRWVYNFKRDALGNIISYKARWVGKGYEQVEGIDFLEKFAPTAKKETERALLAVVAHDDLELYQFDVTTAFLQGKLQEVVYVRQPPGFHEGGPDMVWKLNKPLYGLRQAPRAWYIHLREHLESIGFTASQADASFFTLDHAGDRILLLVYVDDILVAAKSLSNITYTKGLLQDKFEIKDLGEAKFFLGMEIERDRANGTLKLSQTNFIANLAARFDATNTVPTSIPMSPSFELFPKGPGEQQDQPQFPYQSLLGGALYASTGARPELSYPVSALSRVSHCFTQAHVDALLRVLQYAFHTRDLGIVFGTSDERLVGYCDADYGGDASNRKSTSGHVFLMYGGVVAAMSRRQDVVAQSTGEAEYISMAAAGKTALFLRILLADIFGKAEPVKIFTDNTAALTLVGNPIASKRSKHIDVQYHFARDRVMRGELEYVYCNTADMLADCLTKAVPRNIFLKCREGMGVRS
jgi:transposase InsO family protein